MEPYVKLSQEDDDFVVDTFAYRRLIGKMLYLTINRPDLCHSVTRLSQFLAAPHTSHCIYKYLFVSYNTFRGLWDKVDFFHLI